MKTQIDQIKEALASSTVSRDNYKNRPVGCPFYKNMLPVIQQNLTKEEAHKAFYMGLIGNESRKGTIIENAKS